MQPVDCRACRDSKNQDARCATGSSCSKRAVSSAHMHVRTCTMYMTSQSACSRHQASCQVTEFILFFNIVSSTPKIRHATTVSVDACIVGPCCPCTDRR
eukprot:6352907-Prymnesium_polylepis.1